MFVIIKLMFHTIVFPEPFPGKLSYFTEYPIATAGLICGFNLLTISKTNRID